MNCKSTRISLLVSAGVKRRAELDPVKCLDTHLGNVEHGDIWIGKEDVEIGTVSWVTQLLSMQPAIMCVDIVATGTLVATEMLVET